MSDSIPVNPDVLRWARESLRLSQEEVARRIKKNVSDIDAWERGEASPTYIQLERLAYDIYKRPIALFFFPDVPDEEAVEQSFRTLPEQVLELMPSRILYLLRRARVFQLNLAELYDGVNPASRQILRDLDFAPSVEVADMAEQVRAYLGIDLAEQQSWDDADDALKRWRTALEDHGVFVFKDSFNPPGKKKVDSVESAFSGFCLYDTDFPVIYVNNNKAKNRQIFTMFHELAHLLMHTGGVDTRQDDYIEYLTGDNRRIEVLCNQFAAEFLVPSRDFRARLAGMPIHDRAIAGFAELYGVSRETILRRLLDWGRVSRQDYEEKTRQWLEERKESSGSGGNYYLTRGTYLGEKYIEAVFSNYHKGQVSLEQAADYLDVKTRNVAGMEEWLFKQGEAA